MKICTVNNLKTVIKSNTCINYLPIKTPQNALYTMDYINEKCAIIKMCGIEYIIKTEQENAILPKNSYYQNKHLKCSNYFAYRRI